MSKGWKLIPQYRYIDPNEHKTRSVDFLCVKAFTLDSIWYSRFRTSISLECKQLIDKQWVLFTVKMPEEFNDPMNQFTLLDFYEKRKSSLKIPLINILYKLHYFDFQRYAINHYVPFNKTDSLYEAINQTLKAQYSDKEFIKKFSTKFNLPEGGILSLFFPMIVCDDNLFEYKVETNELSESDHLIYYTHALEGADGFSSKLMDVLKVSKFEDSLNRIDQEILKITENLGKIVEEQ